MKDFLHFRDSSDLRAVIGLSLLHPQMHMLTHAHQINQLTKTYT